MSYSAINYFAFLLLSLAIILFFDILYKFKRPLILRYLFLMISIGFLWKGVGYLKTYYYKLPIKFH